MNPPRFLLCRLKVAAYPPTRLAPLSARSSALPVSPEVYRRSISTVPPTAFGGVRCSAMTALLADQPQPLRLIAADRGERDWRLREERQRGVVLAGAVRQRRQVL